MFSRAFPWLESWCLWCHLCCWLPWASLASCYCASLPKTSGSRPPSRCTRSLRRWEAAGPGVRGCLSGTVGARLNALRSHTSAELCLRPGSRFRTSFYCIRGVTATLPEPRGTGGKVCGNPLLRLHVRVAGAAEGLSSRSLHAVPISPGCGKNLRPKSSAISGQHLERAVREGHWF